MSEQPPVLALFGGAPFEARVHAYVRWWTCPFERVAALVPRRGRILEIGCGHGLFSALLALDSRDRAVLGTDIDERKLVVAHGVADRARAARANLVVRRMDWDRLPDGPWDAIAIVDVLYLLDPSRQRALIAAAARLLAPGGAVVVKEIAHHPRWKYRLSYAQESLAVRALKLTRGDGHLSFTPPGVLRAWLEEERLVVREHALDRGYPHPHHALVGLRLARVEPAPS